MGPLTMTENNNPPDLAMSAPLPWRARLRRATARCRRWLRRERRPRVPVEEGDNSASRPEFVGLKEAFSNLGRQSDGLAVLAGAVEKQFLEVASSMELLPQASQAFVDHSHRLVILSVGRDGGESIIESVYSSFERPLQFVDAYSDTARNVRRQLQESVTWIEQMLRREEELSRIVAPLKFIQTLFRVEAVGLDQAVQSMFLALTEEMAVLQQKMSDTFIGKFQVLRDMGKNVVKVIDDLERDERELGQFLVTRKKALAATLAQLKADLDQNKHREAKLIEISNAVAAKVHTLVLGLQAQDIVSQKVAHVRSRITEMAGWFSALSASAEPAAQSRLLQQILEAATVEAAQLHSVQDDLRQTEEQLVGAISLMESEIAHADSEMLSMPNLDRTMTGIPGPIHTLLEAVDWIREMVEATVAATARTGEEMRPLEGRIDNVTATMREMSADIRTVALNAQVQAARIAERAGLEVLAAATSRVANEASEVSEAVAGRLDRFLASMNEIVRVFADMHRRGVDEHAAWRERSQVESSALHSYRDSALQELNLTGEAVLQMQTSLQRMKSNVRLGAVVDERLEEPKATLSRIAEQTKECLQRPRYAAHHADPSAGDHPLRTITMESERRVQEAALAAAGLREHGAESGPAVDGSAHDQNEMNPVIGAHRVTGVAAPAASVSSTLETPPAAPTAQVPDGTSKKEFGDNVDLF